MRFMDGRLLNFFAFKGCHLHRYMFIIIRTKFSNIRSCVVLHRPTNSNHCLSEQYSEGDSQSLVMVNFMQTTFIFIMVMLKGSTCSDGLYCLTCTDAISPRHCHEIRKCSPGEICFVEKHSNKNGMDLFDTGCVLPSACHSKRSISGTNQYNSNCTECCHSDVCNQRGCGTEGFPTERGPLCFNCPQSSDPELCDKVKVCENYQKCHIQREVEFGDEYFTQSCINNHECVSTTNVFGKRLLQNCPTCCATDLCNRQCGDHETTTPGSLYPSMSCPPDWVEFQSACYKYVQEPIDWSKAEDMCKNMGSHLAYIESRAENDFVNDLTGSDRVWLGGTDMHEEGKWVWSSGSSFNFSNFFSTKAINIAAEDCLYMYGDYGQWNDYYCNHRYDFVCERNLG
ncbi:uncharacterized protein LOC125655051 [Ostrea edulis]|uniref:uncharacterized protein LOC125655051 n=1 Tax=Ostrea edulis TaxID=37623 RepID=UPI0024AFC2C5|nr:uncharacterized protein LOC125655051 [Ostrea edulis]